MLTQGTLLTSAMGYILPSKAEPGLLRFEIEEQTHGRARRSLTLLPSDPTDEVRTMLASKDPNLPARFEVSGQVYDYHGRAYLLPAAIVALKNPPPPPLLALRAPVVEGNVAEAIVATTGSVAPMIDAYAEERLSPAPFREMGPAPMEHEKTLEAIASSDDAFARELERRLAAGVRSESVAKPADPTVDRSMILPTAIRLQDSRAAVTRDPLTGVWRAVFESAKVSGTLLAMELLPSRELERLERAQMQSPIGTPWLLSGEVVASGERNYLLLSNARPMPNEHWMYP